MEKMVSFDCKMEMDAEEFERHELAACGEHKAKYGRKAVSMAEERRSKPKGAIMPKDNKKPIHMDVDPEVKEGLNDLAKRSGFNLYVLYEFIMADAVKNPPKIVKDAIEKRSMPEGLVEDILNGR